MDKVIYEDVVGQSERPTGQLISSLEIPVSLKRGLIEFFSCDIDLSPPQIWSVNNGILSERAHYLVSAPTNSGKTLIALLRVFFQAINKGRRSVYVVPLKALAEEKANEIRKLSECVFRNAGPKISVHVSTGDYQLSDDFLGSPPPESGELVICTPERLDVILRNPDNFGWSNSTTAAVVE